MNKHHATSYLGVEFPEGVLHCQQISQAALSEILLAHLHYHISSSRYPSLLRFSHLEFRSLRSQESRYR